MFKKYEKVLVAIRFFRTKHSFDREYKSLEYGVKFFLLLKSLFFDNYRFRVTKQKICIFSLFTISIG